MGRARRLPPADRPVGHKWRDDWPTLAEGQFLSFDAPSLSLSPKNLGDKGAPREGYDKTQDLKHSVPRFPTAVWWPSGHGATD